MIISVSVRHKQGGFWRDGKGRDQLPFATSKAINATLRDIQAAERSSFDERFAVTRRSFLNRLVKIPSGGYATKRRLTGRVGYLGDRADVIAKFEKGGEKVSVRGRRYVAYPSRDIRTGKGGQVKRGMKLSNFQPFGQVSSVRGITLTGSRSTGGKRTYRAVRDRRERLVGQKGAFFIRLRGGRPAIMQRYGRGGRQARLLYLFVPMVRVRPQLNFFRNAEAVTRSTFHMHMRRELAAALRG